MATIQGFSRKFKFANAALSFCSFSKSPFIECQINAQFIHEYFSFFAEKKTGKLKYLMEYKILAVV